MVNNYMEERAKRRIEEVSVGDIQVECIFNLDGTVGQVTIWKDYDPIEIVTIRDEDGRCEVDEALYGHIKGGRKLSEIMEDKEIEDEDIPF